VASMGLAFMVLQNTQSAQCTDKLKSEMRGLESVMLDVALGSPSTSREANLEMATCGGSSVEAIRVVYYDSPSFCGKCPATGGGCWIIEPLAYDKDAKEYFVIRDATTCINMPGRVIIKADVDACTNTELISQGEGCPIDAKDHTNENCGLPPGITSGSTSQLLTLGKATGDTQYKIRVTKGFDTASNDPQLKVCFLRKRDA